MAKTCDKCKHYSPSSSSTKGDENAGSCALIEDTNNTPGYALVAVDRVASWDYEGYRSGAYVGPKFGCIHWEKRDA